MDDARREELLRLLPGPQARVPLRGLYLHQPFGPSARRSKPFVYANFIASLDGRISLPDPDTKKHNVPRAIANERDWRLFQELAAGADALVTTGRYVRALSHEVSGRSFPVSHKPECQDLLRWRRERGLAPQPAVVIVTASLELPSLSGLVASGRTVFVATGNAADPDKIARVEAQGVHVLRAGAGTRVEGGRLIEALARAAQSSIAMIGGGEVLDALLVDDALDRLYLTIACRMLGGLSFDTMLTGPVLARAARFKLTALHYDAEGAEGSAVEQLFAILERA